MRRGKSHVTRRVLGKSEDGYRDKTKKMMDVLYKGHFIVRLAL